MSTLKVNTVLSADTPTVNITDGLNVTGVSSKYNCNVTSTNGKLLLLIAIILTECMQIWQTGTSSTTFVM